MAWKRLKLSPPVCTDDSDHPTFQYHSMVGPVCTSEVLFVLQRGRERYILILESTSEKAHQAATIKLLHRQYGLIMVIARTRGVE